MLGMWWVELLNCIAGIHNVGAGGPTSPVTGSKLWLDASDASTFSYSSGTLVSQWNDKSSNSYAFTQGTVGSQPSRSGTQNTLSTLVFDGSNDLLTSTAASSVWKFLHDGTGATVFVVAKQSYTSNFSSAGEILNTYGTIATSNIGAGVELSRYSSSTSSQYLAQVNNGVASNYVYNSLINATTGNQFAVATFNFDTNNATIANKLPGYLNSDSVNASAAPTWTTSSTANPSQTLLIGCGISSINPFKGEVAEILIYTSILSTTDRNTNINYLRNKWGI
jgi:hypothetical protein